MNKKMIAKKFHNLFIQKYCLNTMCCAMIWEYSGEKWDTLWAYILSGKLAIIQIISNNNRHYKREVQGGKRGQENLIKWGCGGRRGQGEPWKDWFISHPAGLTQRSLPQGRISWLLWLSQISIYLSSVAFFSVAILCLSSGCLINVYLFHQYEK